MGVPLNGFIKTIDRMIRFCALLQKLDFVNHCVLIGMEIDVHENS